MADIISVIVVIVFLVIVFRKRLVPLFDVRKRKNDVQAVVHTAAGVSGTAHSPVHYNVLAFDAGIYENTRTLCLDISVSVNSELNRISCDGKLIDVNYIQMGMLLMFLFKWQVNAAESE